MWSAAELRAVFEAGDEQEARRLCLQELRDPSWGEPSALEAGAAAGHFGLLTPLIEELFEVFPGFDPGVAGLLRAAARGGGAGPGRGAFLESCVCAWSAAPERDAEAAREGLQPGEKARLAAELAVFLDG